MLSLNRRRFLTFTGAAASLPVTTIISPAAASEPPSPVRMVNIGPRVTPEDPRYPDLVTGNNQRFVARPDYVRMIRSPEDARIAVQEALNEGKRVSLRSGGHCFADFVCNPTVEVILDLSAMRTVSYDPVEKAFIVEPGARLIDVYEQLYKGWGVSLPAGICYSVGIGGHIAGGGYGLLSRAHGLTVDHLSKVELVVVGADGKAQLVTASRDPTDPNHDLWWAHTGGGGGNFGVVTKFWFRSPDATGNEPGAQLMSPPSTVLVSAVSFDWDQLDERAFSRILMNFGAWHEKNSDPTSPFTRLSSLFNVSPRVAGSMGMFTQVDATADNAEALLNDYISAILDGTGVAPTPSVKPIGEIRALPNYFKSVRLPWLQATRLVGTNNPTITNPTSRGGHKSAYMKRNFSDRQITVLYKAMTQAGFSNPDTMLVLFSFGGQVNARQPSDTANVQRSSIFKMCFQSFWESSEEDEYYLGWLRDLYSEFFSDTGGVPVPNERYDGCYINYPDKDVRDPQWNRSGVAWSFLYFKENYARLQAVKARWDPMNFFQHSLSIEPIG